jgi:hypothetical protein
MSSIFDYRNTKVAKSILVIARARKVPSTLVKKHWHATKGTTVLSRLRKIAESNKLTLRSLKAKKAVKVVKVKVAKVANTAVKVANTAVKVAKKATGKKVSKK